MEFSHNGTESGLDRLQETISPVCSERLEIVVPEGAEGLYELPKPASKFMPDWYADTKLRYDDNAPLSKSVRACMPFMESLTFGWIIPVPTDIAITRNSNGMKVEWDDDTGFKPMGGHPTGQAGGELFPHEGEILKFNIPYLIRTPEGVSTLYMPPLNRVEPRLMPFSGVVETDEHINPTNIPALLLDDDFEGVIEACTPLVQVIPFKRDSLVTESKTRTATNEELELIERADGAMGAVDAYYKKEVWEPKKASRETGGCPLGFGDDE